MMANDSLTYIAPKMQVVSSSPEDILTGSNGFHGVDNVFVYSRSGQTAPRISVSGGTGESE